MNVYVHQSIIINNLRVGSVTTSSVFQIGSAGTIKSLSKFSNTGEFLEPARPLKEPGQIVSIVPSDEPTGNS
ncbi:spore germination protein GerPB [Ectobacillus antri]|uniref:Spore germination protein GerPB n=1 Tax=Ectobacillus antri TaxID=2486280 RepID=A0ABT6H3G4_9BACI|nr:spore germination protein GerPB [Ectobacillus antri]MDG4656706.1 spore germination protein GerPB [Ectobacillus antri]MDG5753931.1 spore germination protein GerPB [Ectobacillus antri]